MSEKVKHQTAIEKRRKPPGKRSFEESFEASNSEKHHTIHYQQLASFQAASCLPTMNANSSGMASELGVASFLSRLMSLSAHELECLHADGQLMRHLADTRLLLERSLQSIQHQQPPPIQHHLEPQQQHQCLLRVAPTTPAQLYQQLDFGSANHNQHQQQQQQLHQQLQLHPQHQQQHQQQHHQNLAYITADSKYIYQFGVEQLQQALDLRLPQPHGTPGATADAAARSPESQHSVGEEPQQQRQLNPKKVKLSEWRREQVNQQLLVSLSPQLHQQHPHQLQLQQQVNKGPAKRYKGEFDEPSWAEVEQRQRELASGPHNYHRALGDGHRHLGECACVLGSRFQDQRPVSEVLAIIEGWSRLPVEQRLQAKWDVSHLPVDIPLADIKKYEDLRREASGGRADFGGASKRKPLGIRGTRQFLLILYCLWGHPGRQDRMQREGYCPHCFAKIKKPNEQSTLVRVVNHFNMKHRRGANPRLSPAARQLHNSPVSPPPAELHHKSSSPARHDQINMINSPINGNDIHRELQVAKANSTSQQAEHGNSSHLFANLLLLAASSAASSAASDPFASSTISAAADSSTTPQASPSIPHTNSSNDTQTVSTATCRLAAAPDPGTTQGSNHAVA